MDRKANDDFLQKVMREHGCEYKSDQRQDSCGTTVLMDAIKSGQAEVVHFVSGRDVVDLDKATTDRMGRNALVSTYSTVHAFQYSEDSKSS